MRPSVLISLALVAGAVAVFLVARTVGLGATRASGPSVVVATVAIAPGMALQASQLKAHPWPTQPPPGAFEQPAAVLGRVVRQGLLPGEPVLQGRLAPVDGLGGLSATLEAGKRAITVRVNDVVGVAGFALPGTYVDVIVSARDARNEPFARIVLERIKVLAVAQDTVADPTKPKVVNAVTLEVTPPESERLDLARSVGSLSLSLRNETDHQTLQAGGMRLDDLMRHSNSAAAGTPGASLQTPSSRTKVLSVHQFQNMPRATSLNTSAAPSAVQELRGTQEGAP